MQHFCHRKKIVFLLKKKKTEKKMFFWKIFFQVKKKCFYHEKGFTPVKCSFSSTICFLGGMKHFCHDIYIYIFDLERKKNTVKIILEKNIYSKIIFFFFFFFLK